MSTIGQILLILVISILSSEGISYVKQTGDQLSSSCIVQSGTAVWKLNGDPNITEPNVLLIGESGILNYTLVLSDINSSDAGVYECFSKKTIVENFTVAVISIVGENTNLTVSEETPQTWLEISCRVNTSDPDIQLRTPQWKKNGTVLSSTTDRYTFTNSSSESTLNISQPDAADAGEYMCVVGVTSDGVDIEFQQPVSVNMKPNVTDFKKLRSKVEDETAEIECNVTGFPVPKITWLRKLEEEGSAFQPIEFDDRVNATMNSAKVPNATLVIRKLTIKQDRGEYMCFATNHLSSSNGTITLKVKDKLAAVWPFLGICAEVAILCSIIFIFEKRRSRKMEEEEEVDAVKQDLMGQANGGDDNELRQRAVKT